MLAGGSAAATCLVSAHSHHEGGEVGRAYSSWKSCCYLHRRTHKGRQDTQHEKNSEDLQCQSNAFSAPELWWLAGEGAVSAGTWMALLL